MRVFHHDAFNASLFFSSLSSTIIIIERGDETAARSGSSAAPSLVRQTKRGALIERAASSFARDTQPQEKERKNCTCATEADVGERVAA